MLSPAMIVTAFLTGWPSIIAVILNYVKRSEVRGTWLDSHFSWQIRTFWFALLWLTLGAVLFVTVLGIPFAFVLWFATGIWVLYRIIRGWLALSSQKSCRAAASCFVAARPAGGPCPPPLRIPTRGSRAVGRARPRRRSP